MVKLLKWMKLHFIFVFFFTYFLQMELVEREYVKDQKDAAEEFEVSVN